MSDTPVIDAKTAAELSELLAKVVLMTSTMSIPDVDAMLRPKKLESEIVDTPALTEYLGWSHFFGHLKWNSDNKARYNGIVFQRDGNECFDVADFLEQCTVGNTKSVKTLNALFVTVVGKKMIELGWLKPGERFIHYSHLLPILAYGMKDNVAVELYLEHKEWRDTEGVVYMLEIVDRNGVHVFKVGRSSNMDKRMNGHNYQIKCEGGELLNSWEKISENISEDEGLLKEYFKTHGAELYKGSEYFVMTIGEISDPLGDVQRAKAVRLFMSATSHLLK